MNSFNGKVRVAAALTAIVMLLCVLPFSASAATEQNKAQISVSVSDANPAAGEVITVTVSIDNYRTMTPRIAAMSMSLRFDAKCFTFVADSAKSLLEINKGDVTSVAYDGDNTVKYAYTYANSKKSLLPEAANEFFSFQLKVRTDISANAAASLSFTDLTLYNGKDTSRYTLIECKDPIIPTVTVWKQRPPILLNGSADNAGTYTETVTVSFDVQNASLVYEGREAKTITSPYVCDLNGSYTVTLTSNGTKYTETFTLEKEIQSISKRNGTFPSTSLLGSDPDFSNAVIIVNYKDGTTAEVKCTDPDVSYTGLDKDVAGTQTMYITYKGKKLSHEIEVIDKKVQAVTLIQDITKTTYLYGDELDVTGGIISVVYEGETMEEIDLTPAMISGYNSQLLGEQKLSVKYGTFELTGAITVTVVSRDTVDSIITQIEALDLMSIKADDYEKINALSSAYNALSEIEKAAVTNAAKLQSAVDIVNSQLSGGTTVEGVDTGEGSDSTASVTTSGGGSGKSLKAVWIIVAIIVGLSVLAGIVYFLAVYFKNKKELDNDEYYDDDNDTEEDDDSDDEDLFNIEDDDSDKGDDDDDE